MLFWPRPVVYTRNIEIKTRTVELSAPFLSRCRIEICPANVYYIVVAFVYVVSRIRSVDRKNK